MQFAATYAYVCRSTLCINHTSFIIVTNKHLLSRVGSTVTFIPRKGGRSYSNLITDNNLNFTHLVLHRETNSPGNTLPQYFLQESRELSHSVKGNILFLTCTNKESVSSTVLIKERTFTSDTSGKHEWYHTF